MKRFSELTDWVAVTDVATGRLLTVTHSLVEASGRLDPGTCFATGRIGRLPLLIPCQRQSGLEGKRRMFHAGDQGSQDDVRVRRMRFDH